MYYTTDPATGEKWAEDDFCQCCPPVRPFARYCPYCGQEVDWTTEMLEQATKNEGHEDDDEDEGPGHFGPGCYIF